LKRFLLPILGAATLCSALACAVLPRSVHAGAVYRCAGANGQVAFTNRTAGYSNCRKVAGYSEAERRAGQAEGKREEYTAATAPQAAANAADADAAQAPAGDADKATEIHRGAVYKVVRANGVTEYTNMRPIRGGYQLLFTYISTCYACNVHSNVNWRSTALNRTAYRAEVAAAAAEFGVDPALLRAVIHAESAFNPNAVSTKGAEGLMQLIPGTASDMGVTNPFDVSQNIRGGAQYLAGLLKEFKGDERLATAAYNAGPQNVLKYNGVPPFDETRVYVDRVATLRERYHVTE
jgi:soluble lytic murein transglycosylase-like protein